MTNLTDFWRETLYFPLGVLPSIFFMLRMLIQLIQSEKEKKSFVSKEFWQLSLAGNFLLFFHYFIQVQFPFALLQAFNALIAWRNLGLLKTDQNTLQIDKNSIRKGGGGRVLILSLGVLTFVTTLFLLQSYFLIGEIDWIRTPKKPFDSARVYHSLWIHLFGTIGAIIFAARFWIQWWNAERHRRSELGSTFWYLSIFGSLILLVYSIEIRDFVSLGYYILGLIPYCRNLVLLKNERKAIQKGV